eukprot:1666752-Amphidinium_carterae.1
MLHHVNAWGDSVAKWAETCPCHAWLRSGNPSMVPGNGLQRVQTPAWKDSALRVLIENHDGKNYKCPMSGRRATELATGGLQQHMESLNSLHGLQLLPECVDLSEADTAKLLSEFTTACSHMQADAAQKLRCWTILPWKLAGVGHVNADVARSAA